MNSIFITENTIHFLPLSFASVSVRVPGFYQFRIFGEGWMGLFPPHFEIGFAF